MAMDWLMFTPSILATGRWPWGSLSLTSANWSEVSLWSVYLTPGHNIIMCAPGLVTSCYLRELE